MTTNHTDVTRPPNSLSYDEALTLLERADALEEFVDEQGAAKANSWAVRRALQTSKRLLAKAQVAATLAVADELRRGRETSVVIR